MLSELRFPLAQVHAVIGVLMDDTDPLVTVMKVEKAPQETYADIGGLDGQIQEIKVRIFLAFPLNYCFHPSNVLFVSVLTALSTKNRCLVHQHGLCWASINTFAPKYVQEKHYPISEL